MQTEETALEWFQRVQSNRKRLFQNPIQFPTLSKKPFKRQRLQQQQQQQQPQLHLTLNMTENLKAFSDDVLFNYEGPLGTFVMKGSHFDVTGNGILRIPKRSSDVGNHESGEF